MIKNGFYNLLGSIVRLSISLLTIPMLIHTIGIEEYGLWIIVSTVLGFAGLAEAGLSTSTTVFLSQDLVNKDSKGISQTLTTTVVSMLLLATLASFLLFESSGLIISSFKDLQSPQRLVSTTALQVSALVLWSRLLQQVLVGVEQAYERYDWINVLNTIQIILGNLGIIVIAFIGGKTLAFMQWQAVISITTLLIHCIFILCILDISSLRLSWCKDKSLLILNYSISTWMTAIGGLLFTQGDRLIIGGVLGNKLLGVYAAITSTTAQINSFSSLVIQPLLPEISKIYFNTNFNNDLIKQKIKKAFQFNSIFALGIGGSLLTLAPVILNVLIPGTVTENNILNFRVATFIYSIYSTNAVGYYVLLALKMPNLTLIIQMISGVLALSLIAYLTKKMGLTGAFIGNAAYIGTWSLNLIAMKKVSIPLATWIRWIIPSFVWFLAVVFLNLVINIQSNIWIIIVAIVQLVLLSIEFFKIKPIKVLE